MEQGEIKSEESTTISISVDTRDKLVLKKSHPRETYDDVITRLLGDVE